MLCRKTQLNELRTCADKGTPISAELALDVLHSEAGDLPDGFSLKVSRSQASDGGIGSEEHLVYTDGLASVSVFMKPLPSGGKPSRGFAALGGSNAFSTTVEDYQVTVVGEVPADTLRMIAESMRRSLQRSQR